ncbi:MAG: 4-(cytidine 5'-diphospho)-2-C-methyl-D-erythritol kinase [Lachnospiraceae bacterium]|nr:4-(cytidine 5'-diphospho)-2-C-methyl-D-erythritol kinase [Lachnospiraceae bacterium]
MTDSTNNFLTLKAYAKVNLALDVLRKREDGYHDVKMIMQNLDIYDELEFEVLARDTEDTRITLSVNKPGIPTDQRNLVNKAIALLFEEFNIKSHINVNLIKNIPAEAGMAGGSTDCAAALKAVNALYDLGLTTEELMKRGVRLGADVPYCVLGKTSISEGIGEVLTPIKGLPNCHVLVAKPPVNVSTKEIYTNLKANELKEHPDVDGMVEALEGGNLQGITERMSNVLETVTVNMHPEIEELKALMKEMGALNAIMSGSGPTVFGIFDDKDKVWDCAMVIGDRELAPEVFITRPVNA